MKASHCFSTSLLVVIVVISFPWPNSANSRVDDFLDCLHSFHPNDSDSISKVIYTHENASFSSVLNSSIQNLRFSTPTTPKPLVIVAPSTTSHIQATIHCSRIHGLQIRIRSGGHDFEGLSYVSQVPFVVLDMFNLRSVEIDVERKVAWVQSGAIQGEFYYELAKRSGTLAFPAGICHTVAIGGYLSGGGYGVLLRKYGIAVDNVIDAVIVDVKGRILNRKSMGEDLFWAIRGGGGGNFGVVLSWKLKLVSVPSKVTVFNIRKTLEENATELVHQWQSVAPKLPGDVFSVVSMRKVNQSGKQTILASFTSSFLGNPDDLVPLMEARFPELGLKKKDCIEMSWVQSLLLFGQIQNEPIEVLLNRSYKSPLQGPSSKSKLDYARNPIPESGLKTIWSKLLEEDAETAVMAFIAYGGKMDEIAESATPFPHRNGVLFHIAYTVGWNGEENAKSQRYMKWIRNFYSFMGRFVSKSPREAYVGYRDNDIGTNDQDTSYGTASVWGRKYFKNNFDKLVHVKMMIDPHNFFKHEQSIPSGFA